MLRESFHTISINFEKADSETRGKFAFFPEYIRDFSEQLIHQNLGHGFIVSTCNRTELYCITTDIDPVITLFCSYTQGNKKELLQISSHYKGDKAIEHVFKVACGLESQILGDFEIISQLKIAFKKFKKQEATHFYLEKLLNTVIEASKKVKHHTNLSSGTASVSYAAIRYIHKYYTSLKERKIVLLGAGKIGQNTCVNLLKNTDAQQITIINRSEDKAEKLAEKFNINAQPITELSHELSKADVLIVATNAENPIITEKEVKGIENLVIIDLSVPRNVDRQVIDNQSLIYVDVDELSSIIDETLELRKKSIPKAEKIIKEVLDEFTDWENTRKYAGLIEDFKNDLSRLNQHHYQKLKKDNVSLNGVEMNLSELLAQKITNRLAAYIKNNPDKAEEVSALISEMFQLHST